jgi:hypothetical protein
MNSTNWTDKPGRPPKSIRRLDQVREQLRYRHDSLRTEQAQVHCLGALDCGVHPLARPVWGHAPPRDMAAGDVEAYLAMLANERRVSASTHNQALSALLFLYREVLQIHLPWLTEIGRPRVKRRTPWVFTPARGTALVRAVDAQSPAPGATAKPLSAGPMLKAGFQ